jgi:hypothetical protein
MKLYTTVLENSKKLPDNFVEYFVLPDSISEESAKELLGKIKSQSWGYWERLPRKVTSVVDFDPTTFKPSPYAHDRFKFISTSSKEAGDQIFLFSKFVDHDCMYETIQVLEEIGNPDPDFRGKLGAGFTDFKTCFGRSETLNLDSRDDLDTALLVY